MGGKKMKFIFVAPIHNLKINEKIDRKLRIGDLFISNQRNLLDKTIFKEPLYSTIGEHSILEFITHENICSTYAYVAGEVPDILNHEQFIKEINVKNRIVENFLRHIQSILFDLWKVKDNNIYIRDGFFLLYDKCTKNIYINARSYTYSLSEVTTRADLTEIETVFSKTELTEFYTNQQVKVHDLLNITNIDETESGSVPYEYLFNKKYNATKLQKANYYISFSRTSIRYEEKILYYVSALECLMGTTTEIAHQVSERVAFILGSSLEDRMDLYSLIKKSYNIRSKVIHGDGYKNNLVESIKDITHKLDDILRKLIVDHEDLFILSDRDFDRIIQEKIFS